MTNFIQYTFFRIALLLLIYFMCGLLVTNYNIKVNYTRKLTHFAIFFLPFFIKPYFPYENSFLLSCMGAMSLFASFFIFIRPLRSIYVIRVAFSSFDRPEDRPYTLLWSQSQLFFALLISVVLSWCFRQEGVGALMMIPVLIVGIGDGLAEPIGVRFGKHKYKVFALFTKKTYTRSVEGSACVFLSAVVAIFLYDHLFSESQFIAMLLVIPLLASLVEAKSPHTWDTPFIFLIIGVVTYFIKINLP